MCVWGGGGNKDAGEGGGNHRCHSGLDGVCIRTTVDFRAGVDCVFKCTDTGLCALGYTFLSGPIMHIQPFQPGLNKP